MRTGDGGMRSADLDLRIKAGAAFTCDLSTRVGGTGADARGGPRFADQPVMPAIESRWLRRFAYFAFAVAILIPWVLLLADQMPG